MKKPVSIGAAWIDANQFIKREAGLLFPVILLFVAIPMALIFYTIPSEMRQMASTGAATRPELPGSSIVLIMVCSLVIVGGTLSCYALALKSAISLGEALVLGFRRVPVALGAALIMGALVGVPMLLLSMISGPVGTLFMMIAIFLLSARLLLLNAIVVDTVSGPVQALLTSWNLTRGNLGRLLAFVVALTIPIMLAQIAAELLLGLLGMGLGGPEAGRQAGDIGAAAALAAGQVYMIVMTTRIYRQLAN